MLNVRLVFMVAITAVALTIFGCATNKDFFVDSGIFGEHQLTRITHEKNLDGNILGSFFLGCGNITGALNMHNAIQFSWQPKPGEVVITMLPYDKLRFVMDSSKIVPTISFVFSNKWMRSYSNDLLSGNNYTLVDLQNPNMIVQSDYLVVAIVKISRETMEQEIYLPQI